MKIRLLVFIICTLFTSGAILGAVFPFIKMVTHDLWSLTFLLYTITFVAFMVSWVLYFIIGNKWVKGEALEKNYKITEVIFGVSSVILSYGFALLVALPGILLMSYICFFTSSQKT